MDKINLDTLEKRFRESGNWRMFRGEAGLLATFNDFIPSNYSRGDYLRGVLNGNRFEAFIGIWQDHEGVLVRDREFRREIDLGTLYNECESGIIEQLLEKDECEFCYRVNPSHLTTEIGKVGLTPRLAVSSKRLADKAIEGIIINYVATLDMQSDSFDLMECVETCSGPNLNSCCFDCSANYLCLRENHCCGELSRNYSGDCSYSDDTLCPKFIPPRMLGSVMTT